MTREEAKQLLPIIQAYAEGKTVQLRERSNCPNRYVDLGNSVHFDTYPVEYYRIKPEPKYRPFKDAEECWQEMKKHQPFGWIKASHGYFAVMGAKTDKVCFGAKDNFMSYGYLYNGYTFADGTPFGIKEGTDD